MGKGAHTVRYTYLRTRSERERGLAITLLRHMSGAGGGVDICLLGFERLCGGARARETGFRAKLVTVMEGELR